jgi:tetratricopeptide (TPR) repeat protein
MPRIFISYSHQDEKWKDRVVRQLRVLALQGLDTWDDRRISAGNDWLTDIEQALHACDVALLLISPHFLTSNFILNQEVPQLLQRRERQGIRVIPVILSSCAWDEVSWLSPIQARPTDGKPLTGMTKHKAEAALASLVKEVATLAKTRSPSPTPGAPVPPERIDLTRLPAGARHLQGRNAELTALTTAWNHPAANGPRTAIVELIAPGGTGKTALVKRWLDDLNAGGWHGARRVFGWSFYSQGTADDRQASEDHFLDQALRWFGVTMEASATPVDKGRALALAVAASRTLLVLDGLEPLQHPPGPLAGELRAPGVHALLTHLASAGQPGLCVLTSREWLKDLDEWVRRPTHPQGVVLRIDLGNLSDPDGAKLLHEQGVTLAGKAPITKPATDPELQAASHAVEGHALTLTLLGQYLKQAKGGDIRPWKEIDWAKASDHAGGHAFRVIAATERWLAASGGQGQQQLAALRLLGFFDRPASAASLAALRAAPAIPGLTDALQGMDPDDWRSALSDLKDARLLTPGEDGSVDAHPLVREYFAATLAQTQPQAWREGHRRLYQQLQASAPHRPDDLQGLQPLYQAVAHGCKAGLHQEALHKVYVDRILRGTDSDGHYSTNKLGAIGADLGAVACFFVRPWHTPAPTLSEAAQAWLLGEAAFRLHALGRLAEALEPMAAGARKRVEQKNWKNAAASHNNLCELSLSLGQVATAVDHAQQAVRHADQSGDAFQRMSDRTTLADALHQRGEEDAARAAFEEAEGMQAADQPDFPLLYSLRGFQYCDLLLAAAERAAWRGEVNATLAAACDAVAQRATQTLAWATFHKFLLDIALDHLTLARCAWYADRLHGRPPGNTPHLNAAVDGLRQAGRSDYLPRGLLTRAWVRHAQGDTPGAQADLDEAQRIAERGGMKLHLADMALTRARLFQDRAALAQARKLIEEIGYGRRREELADAEARAAAEHWPT